MKSAAVVVIAVVALAAAGAASAGLTPAQALAGWATLNSRINSGTQPTASDAALLRKLLTYAQAHWKVDPVQADILIGFTSRANRSAVSANVRAAVPGAEAYWADHGTYAGLTDKILREYDRGTVAHVAWADTHHYCLENVIVQRGGPLSGRSFAAHVVGPGGTVKTGKC
jgi:hypothetical protein